MADKIDTKKDETTPVDQPTKSSADTVTPATDSAPIDSPSIPVPPPPTDTPAAGTSTNNSLITESAADSAPGGGTTAGAPATPVIVDSKDVDGSAANGETNEKLAEEIEVLTGEIQALEAKIEQLTSGATVTAPDGQPAPKSDVAPISATEKPQSIPEPIMPTPPAQETPEPMAAKESNGDFVNKPSADNGQSIPVNTQSGPKINDISSRPINEPMPAEDSKSDSAGSDNGSGLSIIGEVVSVFGIIIFVLLAISPFFREMLGEDTYQAVGQIGWLSALGTLGLGLLVMLFVKGKGLLKTLLFILLLIAALLFMALNNSSIVAPISSYIDPLLTFYR
ncbi:MAG: hypothetical protein WEC81_00655 [Patescibacteria group bacterium]